MRRRHGAITYLVLNQGCCPLAKYLLKFFPVNAAACTVVLDDYDGKCCDGLNLLCSPLLPHKLILHFLLLLQFLHHEQPVLPVQLNIAILIAERLIADAKLRHDPIACNAIQSAIMPSALANTLCLARFLDPTGFGFALSCELLLGSFAK